MLVKSIKQSDLKNKKQVQRRRPLGPLFLLAIGIVFLVLLSLYLKNRTVYYDIAIINAVVHDGTKDGKSFTGGIGVEGNKIVKIWRGRSWINPRAGVIIDAEGADLTPGFIDTHSHADMSIISSSGKIRADNFIGQGITTIISGNCGRSPVDIQSFGQSIEKRKSNVNVAVLIGLNSIRKKIMQESSVPASQSEIARMCELVKAGMKAGALGVSTGLAYPPGIFASRAEMIAQLKVAKEFEGIHTTHMRSEGGEISKAVDEVIDLSKNADISLLISHLKVTGLKNCKQFENIKNKIAHARSKGMKIYLDYYPYDASSTNLNIFLPDGYLALKRSEKLQVLTNPKGREKLKKSILDILRQEGFSDFKFATVAYYPPRRDWRGKTLDVIGGVIKKGLTPIDAQLDIFLEMESHGGAQMIYHNICLDVLDRIPQEEDNMIGTDSAIRTDNGEYLPHPRGWGTFPRFIKYFVNEKKLLSLDDVIYRMSGLPASVFRLDQRGRIEEDYFADLVLFDSKTLRDVATYEDPFQPPVGIKCVLVNGKIVVNNMDINTQKENQHSKSSDSYPGVFIRRGAS